MLKYRISQPKKNEQELVKSLNLRSCVRVISLGAVLALIILALWAIPAVEADGAISYPASARVSGRIEYGYVVVFNSLRLPQAVTEVAFNISPYQEKLVIAIASNGKFMVTGELRGGLLEFSFPATSSINFTFVFDTIDSSTEIVKVVIPVPLSPAGLISNVAGQVTLPQPMNLKSLLGNVTGATVRYNQSFPPGSMDVVSANISLTGYPIYRVDYLKRRIILKGDRVLFNDTLTVVSLADSWVEQLSFNLPRNATFLGIHWRFKQVPRNYISVYATNQSQLVIYQMLTSLQRRNQRTTLSLVYSFNLTSTLPLYMGLGFVVRNYTIELCLPGIIQTAAGIISETTSGDMHCYEFATKGPLFLYDTYPAVTVTPNFSASTISQPLGIYLAISLTVLAVVGSVFYTSRRKTSSAKTKTLARTLQKEEKIKELALILTTRGEAISNLISQLRNLRERRAGITKITAALRAFEQKDKELERRAREMLKDLEGEWKDLSSKLDEVSNSLTSSLREIEKIERAFKTGRLTKKEYTKMVNDAEEKLIEIARRLSKLSSRYLSR
jgi:signal peptidase I